MKKMKKMGLTVVMLLLAVAVANAQSTGVATTSANIVNPVGLSATWPGMYNDVAVKTAHNSLNNGANTYEITVANFNLDAGAEQEYSITMPSEMALRNQQATSCITAIVNRPVAGQQLPNGTKQFIVDAEIFPGHEQVRGKHSAEPFEVTVNFN